MEVAVLVAAAQIQSLLTHQNNKKKCICILLVPASFVPSLLSYFILSMIAVAYSQLKRFPVARIITLNLNPTAEETSAQRRHSDACREKSGAPHGSPARGCLLPSPVVFDAATFVPDGSVWARWHFWRQGVNGGKARRRGEGSRWGSL